MGGIGPPPRDLWRWTRPLHFDATAGQLNYLQGPLYSLWGRPGKGKCSGEGGGKVTLALRLLSVEEGAATLGVGLVFSCFGAIRAWAVGGELEEKYTFLTRLLPFAYVLELLLRGINALAVLK